MGKHVDQMDSINKVAVLGSGVMGIDIALLFALHDFSVCLWHRTDQDIAKGRLDARIHKYREKEIISEKQEDTIRKRIKAVHDVRRVANCDLVIETIVDDFTEKRKV